VGKRARTVPNAGSSVSGSIIGNMADSIRLETANKQLQRGPDLAWAERILERKARGEVVCHYSLKQATEVLAAQNRKTTT
jgi:hypothetical protein